MWALSLPPQQASCPEHQAGLLHRAQRGARASGLLGGELLLQLSDTAE